MMYRARSQRRTMLLVLIVALTQVSQGQYLEEEDDPLRCHTSDNKLGDCRPWKYCKLVRDEYPQKKPTICLYRPLDPIVCCPRKVNGQFITTTTLRPNALHIIEPPPNLGSRPQVLPTANPGPAHHLQTSSRPEDQQNAGNSWQPVTRPTQSQPAHGEGAAIRWPSAKPVVPERPASATLMSTKRPFVRPSKESLVEPNMETGGRINSNYFMGHQDCGLTSEAFPILVDLDQLDFRRRKRDLDRSHSSAPTPDVQDAAVEDVKELEPPLFNFTLEYFDSLEFDSSESDEDYVTYTEPPPPSSHIFPADQLIPSSSSRPSASSASSDGNSSETKASRLGAARGIGADYVLLDEYDNQVDADDLSGLQYITGGANSVIGRWPWLVLIGERRRYSNDWFCSGALLNDKFVITAAHCLGKFQKNRLLVRVGEFDLNYVTDASHQDMLVDRIYLHPDYRPQKKHHDIGLLRMRRSVRLTDQVTPICLPRPHADLTGHRVSVAGWGHTQFGGESSAVLQEVTLPLVDTAQCEAQYRTLKENFDADFAPGFGDTKICAHDTQGTGKDACQGDSGGPLTYENPSTGRVQLVGIVSTGVGCGHPEFPGIYTRVAMYTDWIREKAFDGF